MKGSIAVVAVIFLALMSGMAVVANAEPPVFDENSADITNKYAPFTPGKMLTPVLSIIKSADYDSDKYNILDTRGIPLILNPPVCMRL